MIFVRMLLKKMLKSCNVSIILQGDDLTVSITLGGIDVFSKTFDLLKDGISK